MLSFLTAPATQPVTLAEAKANSRITTSAEDTLIESMIAAATQDAEGVMQRAIMPQQWKLTLDAFPCAADGLIKLWRPIVRAVDSVKYFDDNGVQRTLATTEYQTDLSGEYGGRLAPVYGKSWPTTRVQLAAVEVLFTCGWENAAAVPPNVKRWILMRVAAFYENRESWTLGKKIERNEFVDRMLDRWCVPC